MRSFVLALAAAALVGLGAGCTVQTRPAVVDGYAVVGAQTVPPDIYAYPHTWYHDRYAYFVDGRWYYPNEGGWVVFNEEPTPLYRWRMQSYGGGAYGTTYGGGYLHTAPPAPAPGGVHVAPPAYGGGPSPGYPPPPPR